MGDPTADPLTVGLACTGCSANTRAGVPASANAALSNVTPHALVLRWAADFQELHPRNYLVAPTNRRGSVLSAADVVGLGRAVGLRGSHTDPICHNPPSLSALRVLVCPLLSKDRLLQMLLSAVLHSPKPGGAVRCGCAFAPSAPGSLLHHAPGGHTGRRPRRPSAAAEAPPSLPPRRCLTLKKKKLSQHVYCSQGGDEEIAIFPQEPEQHWGEVVRRP